MQISVFLHNCWQGILYARSSPSENDTIGIQKQFVNFPITVSFTTFVLNRTFAF